MSASASDFMINLLNQLIDEKKLSEKSAQLYLKYLIMLNDKQPFKNLTFLKDTEKVLNKLNDYSNNTKKTVLSGVVSVLSLLKDKPTYKKTYKFYYDKMMEKANEMKNNVDPNEKTKQQNDNWMDWDKVVEIKNKLMNECVEFSNNKLISPAQFNKLLNYLILCLYTEIPPRRNQDYMEMYVVNEYKDNMDKNKNYLDISNKKLIFNHYKTQKKYGTQTIDISETPNLMDAIYMYLRFHPLNPYKKFPIKLPKNTEFKFLVYPDGSGFNAVNSITRILNKIFNKKIGSSMLRHIYLSSKYNIDEMKEDAEQMGHSLEQQKEYLKTDKKEEKNINIEKPKLKLTLKGGNINKNSIIDTDDDISFKYF